MIVPVARGLAVLAALLGLASACSGTTVTPSRGAASNAASHAVASSRAPLPSATPQQPWARVGAATPKRDGVVRGAATVLVSESFRGTKTKHGAWIAQPDACLTAGVAGAKPSSIPKCGSSAPQDKKGHGALELTPPDGNQTGFAMWHAPLSTANGLEIRFTLFAFDGTTQAADGTLLFFTDGSKQPPPNAASNGGCLGYFQPPSEFDCETLIQGGLPGAYLGIGFDEGGNFSNFSSGGPGFVPETVAFCGADSTGYHYLGGVTNASGEPASLPFDLNEQSETRPANGPTIDVLLTSAGLLQINIDDHDGNGFAPYVFENIVGLYGEPAVPATVYVGLIGSTGGDYVRHQIRDLTISTLE